MRNLFKNIGYKLYLKQQTGSKRISFSYIPNRMEVYDGFGIRDQKSLYF